MKTTLIQDLAIDEGISISEYVSPNFGTHSAKEVLESVRVNQSEIVEAPPAVIGFNNGDSTALVGSRSNFSSIIGKAKSKKTFLASMLMAAALSKNQIFYNIKIHFDPSENELILFDTEQATHKVQSIVRRILEIAGLPGEKNFYPYCLRKFSPKDRLKLIEERIKNTLPGSIIIIDGIKDLVFDINDGKEATELTTALMKWTEEKDIHIVVILHQNKGDNNARGHLGTEVVNKSETVLSVTKDRDRPGLSIVQPEYCRNQDFDPFAFSIDEFGYPYIETNWKGSTINHKTTALSPHTISEEKHTCTLKEIFVTNNNPTHRELVELLKNCFAKHGLAFGRNKALQFISYYTNKQWIKKEKIQSVRYPVYVIHQAV